ncbi:hypothetical protein AHAS_Ahas15G0270400 [Arachis hypogaea]
MELEIRMLLLMTLTPQRPKMISLRRKIPRKPRSTTPEPDLQIIAVREETCSQPLEIAPIAVSLPSSLKEELIKDDFTYDPSKFQTQEASVTDNPSKLQQQPCQEAPAVDQSKEQAHIDGCPLELKKQAVKESSLRKAEPKPPLNVDARPRQWDDDAPSFSLGISPLASQPSASSQPTVSQLEILADKMVDVGWRQH